MFKVFQTFDTLVKIANLTQIDSLIPNSNKSLIVSKLELQNYRAIKIYEEVRRKGQTCVMVFYNF